MGDAGSGAGVVLVSGDAWLWLLLARLMGGERLSSNSRCSCLTLTSTREYVIDCGSRHKFMHSEFVYLLELGQ